MLDEMKNLPKVVGLKQSRKALRDGQAVRVYAARDADDRLTAPILSACREAGIDCIMVDTMEQLGHACGVEVGAAVAALVKQTP